MSKPCTFCEHPDRVELETALLRREITQTEAADRLKVSQAAVGYHISNHLPEAVRLAISEEKDLAAGLNVAEQLMEINKASREILAEAREGGDPKLALQAIDRVERQLRLQAERLGDITSGVTVNVINNPQYLQFRGLVLKILADYPEARARLVKELKEGSQNESVD